MSWVFRLSIILFCSSILLSNYSHAASIDDDEEEEEIANDISLAPSSFTEEQRLKGFSGHRLAAAEFERIRLSGVYEVKRQKHAWDKAIADTLPRYKEVKAQRAAALDESSPEYKEDLHAKKEDEKSKDAVRKKYIQARDLAKARQKQTIQLTEAEEYDLNKKLQLVDVNKRALYGAVAKNKTVSAATGSGTLPTVGGSFDSGVPSVPPPPQNDFYEPDVPPPPPPLPPMDSGFDDSIPPPIFEEPEF